MKNKSTLIFKELPLKPISSFKNEQRPSSKDERINDEEFYIAKIYGKLYGGYFSKQWYGWSFCNWGVSGIQLDLIERVWVMKK